MGTIHFLTHVTQFNATTVESHRLLLPAERRMDDKTKLDERMNVDELKSSTFAYLGLHSSFSRSPDSYHELRYFLEST